MGKFLFTNLWSDDLGLPTRTVPIAEILSKMGHDVWFCNPGASPDKVIREAGLVNIIPGLSLGPTILAPWSTEVWNVDHFSAMFGYLDEKYVAHCVEAVLKVIQETDTEVVVDSWNLFACMAARILRKPLVSIIQADMHPRNKGFMWWREPPTDLPSPVSVFNKILLENDLNQLKAIAELFVGDLTLCVGTPETDPIPTGESVIHVGPIFYQKTISQLPHWFKTIGAEKPLVWVYSGNPEYAPGMKTFGDSIIVLEASIEALGNKDVQVIVTTGHHELPESLLPLPDNFRFEKFIPGIALASRCDLMIHHGGHGSTMTGAYTGTPAVIIPTYSERESNARRMTLLGTAEFVLPVTNAALERTLSPEILWDKVRKVLSDPSYTENAKKVREKMLSYGGEKKAAQLISDFADSLRP